MIGIPLGLLYSNGIEWLVHRYVLHGLGKRKGSWWNFHWGEHHKNCRRYGMADPDYTKPLSDWNARGKEAAGIALLVLAHLPLLSVAPWFTAAVGYSGFNYLRKHRRAHRDPEWALENMKWHVDHHMGKNQDANWCVTQPWFDLLAGTRIDYEAGTLRVNPPSRPARERELPSGVHPANDATEEELAAEPARAEPSVPPPGTPPPGVVPPPIAA